MKTIIFFFMFFLIVPATGQTNLNLDKLTLNGTIIRELTVEKLTNMLGRPSSVTSNKEIAEIIGPMVYYHNKGLGFIFFSKSEDPKQRVHIISIYLSKTWDEGFDIFYSPFSGVISPKLNTRMKIDEILPLFKNKKVSVQTADEIRALLTAKNIDPTKIREDIIKVESAGCVVNIFCEEVTKYLERLSIILD